MDQQREISSQSKKLAALPSEYTKVKPLIIDHHTDQKLWAPLPSCNFNDFTEFIEVSTAFVEEVRWLKEVNNISRTRSSETSTLISGRAQHHATFKRGPDYPPGINTILPLLRDKVNTLKMQSHIMILNINSTKVLNPSQTPVDVSDCPVYALTKELQWRYPNKFGNYFSLMGSLHIEQSLLITHGQLIEGTGLPEILEQHKFSTIGLSAAIDLRSIKRARYCVQMILCVLYMKLEDAVSECGSTLEPFDWLNQQTANNEMCFYWKMMMEFQMQILMLVRSIRESNFKLYVEVLRKVIRWYFVFDHFN